MDGLQVKELPGAVLIAGLSSQPIALQLCARLRSQGVKTTIGMLPGIAGYQVSLYRVSIDDVKEILDKLGIEAQSD